MVRRPNQRPLVKKIKCVRLNLLSLEGEFLRKTGLTPSEGLVLVELKGQKKRSHKQLQVSCGLNRSELADVIGKLFQKELLVRVGKSETINYLPKLTDSGEIKAKLVAELY